MRILLLLVVFVSVAHAQGGHFGEGAPPGFFIKLLVGIAGVIGALIALALLIVKPERSPPIKLTGAVLGGMGLAIPITALAVVAIFWLEALWPGIVVALGLGGAYVALVRRRWSR